MSIQYRPYNTCTYKRPKTNWNTNQQTKANTLKLKTKTRKYWKLLKIYRKRYGVKSTQSFTIFRDPFDFQLSARKVN